MPEDAVNAKELKAARRAEKVAAKAAQQPVKASEVHGRQAASSTSQNTLKKTSSAKNAGEPPTKGNNKKATGAVVQPTSTNDGKAAKAERTVGLFSHLEQKKALKTDALPKDVHPAVVTLALRCSSGQCIGSNTRCIAMLRTFQKVIREYSTPSNFHTSLQRHLPTYLSVQISYLVTARPLSTSMGFAIRALKQQISTTDIGATDETNKAILIDFIDTFIKERIEIAGQVIVKSACERLVDGDVVLVYAHSTIVESIVLEAARSADISVIVVDSRPNFEGKKMVANLAKAGVKCTYIMLTAVSYVMETVSKVVIGAHTVLSNGAVYSRVGTAVVAMVAHEYHVPVIVACETYKFSDRVQLDSFVTNELGTTADLDRSLRELVVQSPPISTKPSILNSDTSPEHHTKASQLMKLNLMYDVTPDKYITICISELGSLPTTAIPFAAANTVQ